MTSFRICVFIWTLGTLMLNVVCQTMAEIDLTGLDLVDFRMNDDEDIVRIVFSMVDGRESTLVIEKYDNVYKIMNEVCDRLKTIDCTSVMDQISLKLHDQLYTPSLPHATVEDFNSTRTDIVRLIAQLFQISDYLEIGTAKNDTFKVASNLFPNAVGVDPVEGGTLRMTSDEFFASNTATFDLIFVDGLHEADQVFRDIHNALENLNPGGIVLMHDCNPRSFAFQDVHHFPGALWSGDVWKAAVALRLRHDIEIVMVDVDYGVGVIRKRPNRHPLPAEWIKYLDVNPISMLMYDLYDKHRYTLHRFMTVSDVRQWLTEEMLE